MDSYDRQLMLYGAYCASMTARYLEPCRLDTFLDGGITPQFMEVVKKENGLEDKEE